MKVKFFYSTKDQPGEQYPCDTSACVKKIDVLKKKVMSPVPCCFCRFSINWSMPAPFASGTRKTRWGWIPCGGAGFASGGGHRVVSLELEGGARVCPAALWPGTGGQ